MSTTGCDPNAKLEDLDDEQLPVAPTDAPALATSSVCMQRST
ncbi:hypothetical protein [Ornithinimicrobium sp. INDO-MA30-4]|nr:hypothetical protein [Ornithinimicrobium sp. INDO-MA30-4]